MQVIDRLLDVEFCPKKPQYSMASGSPSIFLRPTMNSFLWLLYYLPFLLYQYTSSKMTIYQALRGRKVNRMRLNLHLKLW